MRIYDENLCYDLDPVSESWENGTILFRITKTVYGDKECRNAVSQRDMERRLKVDDNNNIYCGKSSKKIWFNWNDRKIKNHYSIH